jgi:hypothetical protein
MRKKRGKKERRKIPTKLQIWADLELVNAAMKVAQWDHKTLSQYIRDLILEDVRSRGALPRRGEEN